MTSLEELRFPLEVRERLMGVHGEPAAAWLERLPSEIDRLAAEWGFELGAPFPNLSYAYVAPVTMRDGSEAVLKVQPPHMESHSGIPALQAWNGNGAVRLLAVDPGGSYELLERARPGVTLADAGIDDDEATRILVNSMPPLWVDPPRDPRLISIERWGHGLAEYIDAYPAGDGPLPHDLVIRARDTYAEMLATSPPPKLLHGDLHHGNLLSATRAPWLVIDPKGVIGDPAFEVSPLFFNPWALLRAAADIPALIRRRYAIVCEELDLDPYRIAAWGFARAVLSHCWSVEDAEGMEPHMIEVAEALWELR